VWGRPAVAGDKDDCAGDGAISRLGGARVGGGHYRSGPVADGDDGVGMGGGSGMEQKTKLKSK
jgi:hypothetical protein